MFPKKMYSFDCENDLQKNNCEGEIVKAETAFFDEPSEKDVDGTSEFISDQQFEDTTTNRLGSYVPRFAIAGAVLLVGALAAWFAQSWLGLVVGVLLAALAYSCTHVILEWERAVVVRLGKISRVAGSGIFFTIPFIESVAAVIDQRMRSSAFKAERVLTSDLVPVDVDAVIFWMVFDAKKACTEVRNFNRLVYWVSQTTLRDVMGSISLAELSSRRVQIDREVKQTLEAKTAEWGITIVSVEIRDIVIPEDLQESLSVEAQAKQEYNARIILAEVEREVSAMFVDAARTYKEEDTALQLRAMSFIHDGVKEKGGLVVVPSSMSQAFEGLADILPKD